MSKLQYTKGQVVIRIDIDGKDKHIFEDGTEIKVIRRVNNLNRRHTEPVNAFVVSAENIPEGSEILIHHNSLHDTYRIFNYQPLSGEVIAKRILYYSIPESECFVWRETEQDKWKPCKDFALGLRVFRPYKGIMQGIEPTLIKDCLYITSGELKGNVCYTLKSCDYEIIFLDHGKENRLIRCRHREGEEEYDREEIVGIANLLTDELNCGELLVGYEPENAKKLNAEAA